METIPGSGNWKLTIRREAAGITILRAATCDARARLPETLYGLPVTALGDHALSPTAASAEGEDLLVTCGTGTDPGTWSNRDLEDLTHFLPDVRTVCVYGGADMQKQANRLKKGCQIVVATPGRLMDHMRHKSIDVSAVTSIVLDEADEMLNMGFYKDVRKIIDAMKARKSLCMFSATISREVMDIGWLYQRDAEEIIVQPVQASQPKITQYTLCTTGRSKLADVAQIIISGGYKRVMVFCNTKFTTATLTNQLARLNFVTDCLHGDLSQGERNKIMAAFREGKIGVLVATDVAARGIDVEDVDAVINYEVPSSNEYYTHRIGRTGRAKKEGVSYLLYDASEKKRVDELLRLTRSKATPVHWDESHTTLIEEKVDTGDKFQIRSYF